MSESISQYRARFNSVLPNTIPFFYDCANEYNSSIQPNTLRQYDNYDFMFFQKYFLQELYGIIQIDGFPENWNKQFFLWNVLFRGWIAIVNSESYGGWIPQPCVWGAERNVFQFPLSVIVQNGWFNPENGKIEFSLFPDINSGESESAIITFTPDYTPLADIATQYAIKAATLFPAITNSAVLCRNGYILQADNKADAVTLEKSVQGILNGELIVTVKSKKTKTPADQEKSIDIFESDIRKHYIVGDLLEDLQTIIDMFHAAIGYPIINRAKKERTISSEQTALNASGNIKPDLWEMTINDCLDKFNSISGYNIHVKLKYPDETGGKDVSDNSVYIDN